MWTEAIWIGKKFLFTVRISSIVYTYLKGHNTVSLTQVPMILIRLKSAKRRTIQWLLSTSGDYSKFYHVIVKIKGKPRSLFCNTRTVIGKLMHIIIYNENDSVELICDWLFTALRPFKNLSLIWRLHHCRWRAAKFRPILDAQGLIAGRDLYRATQAVTRGLRFSGLIRRAAPIKSPLTTHEGMWRIYSNLDPHGKSWYVKTNFT
jgi:hypothetical protein